MTRAESRPMTFAARGPLKGSLTIPGDKSISHRALMLSALAVGQSRISNLSEGSDILSTAAALAAMGARFDRGWDGAWTVNGAGVGGLLQPGSAFDMGNSGTSTRLLMGLVATHNISATFTGDASLSRRPMDRVIGPLQRMGAKIVAGPGGRLPLTVRGVCPAHPLTHRLTIASAQVKSALLLAALNTPGITRLIEPIPTRDHSERLLKLFGAEIEVEQAEERSISLRGQGELKPQRIDVAGDPSSAAFLAVAALIVPGSEILLRGVGINPMRTGLFRLLQEMGADVAFEDARETGGEPVADLRVRHSTLRAIDVPTELVPAMIDEFPIFFVAAAFAEGRSRAHGLAELRVKESDRITAMAEGLRSIGVNVEESDDGLVIQGSGGEMLLGCGRIASQYDHRIAMSFAVSGLHCREPLIVDDMSPVATSFPGFAAALDALTAS